uniref:Transcriptional regulator ATRX n=1 Tax=Cacopsylla melanoneura TaxID=428564 RepID=A0A8D8XXQ5_9HEMI
MSNKIKRGPHNLFVSYVQGEVEFRKKHFKNVEDLYKFKDCWKCSMCSCSLESSILKGSFCKHPALGVLVCNKCLEYYGDGLFSPDEEGEDKFCRWCAQGGELYCCSKCVSTFCKKCINRHFKDNKKVLKSLDEEDWECFLCVSKPIWFLRALCWAVYHFKNEFVKSSNDGDSSRSSRQRACISNKRGHSTSSEEEESSVSKRKETQRKPGPHSKTKSESVQSDSSDEDFKKKSERHKRKRNRRDNSEDRKTTKSRKQEPSEDEEESSGEKQVRKKPVGPKSRTLRLRNKTSKEKSDTSEDEEEEKMKPKPKVENNLGTRTRNRDENKSSSREEESRKTRPGPKSKVDSRKTRKNESAEDKSDASEDGSADEKSRKTKPGPKSRVKKPVLVESEEDSQIERKARKANIGPKSRVDRRTRGEKRNENQRKESSDEEEEEEENNCRIFRILSCLYAQRVYNVHNLTVCYNMFSTALSHIPTTEINKTV